jgi:hypothetical protein
MINRASLVFMKRLLAALGLAALCGCCHSDGASPAYITYFLNHDYDGHPATQFFASYGYPSGAFERANGSRVYIWASSRYKAELSHATPTDFTSSGGNFQMVDTYHGSTERQYCEIRVYADAADTIKDFIVAVDSTGRWSASRCSEIFD